jgi:protein-S-isoprenylcysteine O-methyltransferase Ste14
MKNDKLLARNGSLVLHLSLVICENILGARMESWGVVAQRIRVPAGTLLGVIFLLLMRPSRSSLWLGGGIALCGAGIRTWAAGHIDKGRVLARSGPYAFTRNPLYFGSLVMAIGVIVAGRVYWLLLPFVLFYLTVYYPVMRAEEQELLGGYGEEFSEYARKVPLFFPRFTTAAGGSSRFLWSRVLQNREHRTLGGLLLTEAFLILRSLY